MGLVGPWICSSSAGGGEWKTETWALGLWRLMGECVVMTCDTTY